MHHNGAHALVYYYYYFRILVRTSHLHLVVCNGESIASRFNQTQMSQLHLGCWGWLSSTTTLSASLVIFSC